MYVFVMALVLGATPSEFHEKPYSVEGTLLKEKNEFRVYTKDGEYILNLKEDQQEWCDRCVNEPVKIAGTYLDGGKIEPKKLAHYYLDETAWAMVCEANRYRAAANLPALRVCPNLLRSSLTHCWNMRHRYGFRHGGTSGWAGENIAAGQPDPASVTRTWYNSPGHRANMLGGYRFIGVGHYNGLWTQQFR